MAEIEFPLSEALRGKNIQKILFYPVSCKVLIWHNNKPAAVDVDLKDIKKTAQNFDLIMNGKLDSITKEDILLIISDGLAPYMNTITKGGYNGNSVNDEKKQKKQKIPKKQKSRFRARVTRMRRSGVWPSLRPK